MEVESWRRGNAEGRALDSLATPSCAKTKSKNCSKLTAKSIVLFYFEWVLGNHVETEDDWPN